MGNRKYTVQRSKGLGENDPDMMWETTMNPKSRRLIRISPEDAQITADVFDMLLWDNLPGRKDFIAEGTFSSSLRMYPEHIGRLQRIFSWK